MKKILDKIIAFYKKISDVATPTAILAIICIVVTLALSSANLLTKDAIKELKIKNENAARQKLMDGDYEEAKITIDGNEINYHIVKDKTDDKIVGYIFKTAAKGYGGEITVMTAVKADASVAAVEILDASGETPGLGQNVTKESFYGQFECRPHDVVAVKGGAADKVKNEINAVTGATISSKAVTAAVNKAIDYTIHIIESSDGVATIVKEILPKGDELK